MRDEKNERKEEKREERASRLGRESLRALMARQDLCPVEWESSEPEEDGEDDDTPMLR